MLSDAIRRRLELLNRAPLDRALAEPANSAAEIRNPLSQAATTRDELALFRSGGSPPVDCRQGAVEFAGANGTHLRLRRTLTTFCPRWGLDRCSGQPSSAAAAGPGAHPELLALAAHYPRGTLYLDLETCGFAGSMIFLVGLVWCDEGELWLDQLLARNYAEERAMLTTLWQIAAPMRVLVTFNGKSFDWPMVKDRSTLHRLSRGSRPRDDRLPSTAAAICQTPIGSAARSDGDLAPADLVPWNLVRRDLVHGDQVHGDLVHGDLVHGDLVHCDLLHHSRRRWRGRLPDCRLQTLERTICRRHRSGDIPGAQVPRVYHDYVRSGDLRVIEPVLHHNALDLVTLLQIGQALVPPAPRAAESA